MSTIFNLTSCVFILFLLALIFDILSNRLLFQNSPTKQRITTLVVWGSAMIAYLFIVFNSFYPVFLSKNDFMYSCVHVLSLGGIQFTLQSSVWVFIKSLMPASLSLFERNEVRIWGGLLSTVISVAVLTFCLGAIDACFAMVGVIMSLIGLLFWALADTLCFADRLYSGYKSQTEVLHKAIHSQMRHQFTINTPVILGSISITRGWFLLLPIIAASVASVFFILAFSWLQIIQVETHALRHLDLFVSVVFPIFAASTFVKGDCRSKGRLLCCRTVSWLVGLVVLILSICRFMKYC
ncbi:MAG: hypothetical protein ACRDCN_13165 [Tannerellaceae bacterium]